MHWDHSGLAAEAPGLPAGHRAHTSTRPPPVAEHPTGLAIALGPAAIWRIWTLGACQDQDRLTPGRVPVNLHSQPIQQKHICMLLQVDQVHAAIGGLGTF